MWKAVLTALVVLGPFSACDDSGPAATPDRPASLVHQLDWSPVVLADGCPPIDQRLLFPPGGVLPKGANVVRLCNGRQTPKLGAAYRYDMPSDVLATGIDGLIDQVNRLQPPEPLPSGQRRYCADDGGTDVNFWFGYPDGTAAAITWHPYGCRWLQLSPNRSVEGGRDLLASYADALAAQRQTTRIPSMPPAPHCTPSVQPTSPLGTGALGALANVTYCVSIPHRGWREAKVPRALVQRISEEVATGHQGDGCPSRRAPWLRATTTTGDHLVFYPALHCSWTLPVMPDTREPFPSWRPSKDLAHDLKALPLGKVRR